MVWHSMVYTVQRFSIVFNQQNDTAVVHVNGVKILITTNGFLFFILFDRCRHELHFEAISCIAMRDNGSQSRSKSHSQSIRLGISVRSTSTSAALVSLWLKHRSIFKTITKFELHELIYSEINLRFNHKMPRIYGEFKVKKKPSLEFRNVPFVPFASIL